MQNSLKKKEGIVYVFTLCVEFYEIEANLRMIIFLFLNIEQIRCTKFHYYSDIHTQFLLSYSFLLFQTY